MKVALSSLVFILISTAALAQQPACRRLPEGPQREACIQRATGGGSKMGDNPGRAAKLDRCRMRVKSLGATGRGGGGQDLMVACMRGKM